MFTVVPLVELNLLLWLSARLGFWETVAIVLTTGVVGAALAKREGLKVLQTWQSELAAGRMPEEGIVGSGLVLVGGVLLVTPGVLTDAVGLLLLFSPSRRVVRGFVQKWFERSVAKGQIHVVGGIGSLDASQDGSQGKRSSGRGAYIDAVGEEIESTVQRSDAPPRLRD